MGSTPTPTQYPTEPVPIDHDLYKDVGSFIQIFDTRQISAISDHEFFSAPFKELCPSGDCVEDCKRLGRLFEAVPDGVDMDASAYGRSDSDERVTLFGICSNLARAAERVSMDNVTSAAQDYFPVDDPTNNDLSMVISNIASCFASTCDLTREPDKCKDACSLDNFLASPSQLNFNSENSNTGALACVSRLCDNTCGLPYADQDVLGIGVLTSYYIQALVLIVAAAVFIASAAWQTRKRPSNKLIVTNALRKPLETLVNVQACFGFSIAIASFVMHPATIDPLNGYALICAAIMGFLPPVFTLMLLHSHGIKSWFSTEMVFVSYITNTVTFFMLYRNLSATRYDSKDLETSLHTLFRSTACGGSSAMTLCQQLTGLEPLKFLDLFFNKGPIPNIRTVPILWGWTTLVLLVLMTRSILQWWRSEAGRKGQGGFTKPQTELDAVPEESEPSKFPKTRVALLLLASILFCLCLGYQFLVVREYQKMDVIDKDGWSFGQVVAVLFWVPPLLDVINSLLSKDDETPRTNDVDLSPSNHGSYAEKRRRAPPREHLLPLVEEQWPLASSPTPSRMRDEEE